jgi:hypothetical protein
MSEDALSDRRRASEEEYFRKRDQQLIERLRKQADGATARNRLSQRAGLADEELLQRLESLGFSDETVSLLQIVPLVHVAWADGAVSPSASQRVLDASREHGIEERSDAGRQLREWLERRPSDAIVDAALHAIRTALAQQSVSEREQRLRTLLEQCVAVADASGGVLGFGSISTRERTVLERIRRDLGYPPHSR